MHAHLSYITIIQSMAFFLADPKGDMPWEEELTSKAVKHIDNPKVFHKLIQVCSLSF